MGLFSEHDVQADVKCEGGQQGEEWQEPRRSCLMYTSTRQSFLSSRNKRKKNVVLKEGGGGTRRRADRKQMGLRQMIPSADLGSVFSTQSKCRCTAIYSGDVRDSTCVLFLYSGNLNVLLVLLCTRCTAFTQLITLGSGLVQRRRRPLRF